MSNKTKIYRVGRKSLTIWDADSSGQLVMTTTVRPLPGMTTTEWQESLAKRLKDEGFRRLTPRQGRGKK